MLFRKSGEIDPEIDRLIVVVRDYRQRPIGSTYTQLRHKPASRRPEEVWFGLSAASSHQGLLVKASQSSGVFGVNSTGLLGRGVTTRNLLCEFIGGEPGAMLRDQFA